LVDITNLAVHFGTGFALRSAHFEITQSQPLQGSAERVLPWLETHAGPVILLTENRDAGHLDARAIISGFNL